jgi:hypothetical protein
VGVVNRRGFARPRPLVAALHTALVRVPPRFLPVVLRLDGHCVPFVQPAAQVDEAAALAAKRHCRAILRLELLATDGTTKESHDNYFFAFLSLLLLPSEVFALSALLAPSELLAVLLLFSAAAAFLYDSLR